MKSISCLCFGLLFVSCSLQAQTAADKRKETLDNATERAATVFAEAEFCDVGDATIRQNLLQVIRLTGTEQDVQHYSKKFEGDRTVAFAGKTLMHLGSRKRRQACEGAELQKIVEEQLKVSSALVNTLNRIRTASNAGRAGEQAAQASKEPSAVQSGARESKVSGSQDARQANATDAKQLSAQDAKPPGVQEGRASGNTPGYLLGSYRCFTRTMGFNNMMITTPTNTTFTIRSDGTYVDPVKEVGRYRVDPGAKTITFLNGNLQNARGSFEQMSDGKGRVYLSFGQNDNGWAGQNCAVQ